jgi:hypothetical protein
MSNLQNDHYDLWAALTYNDLRSELARVVAVLAFIEGEHDGAEYHWIVQLDQPNVFAYVNGACDYTGWDCRSWCNVQTGETIAAVLSFAAKKGGEIAATLAEQIDTSKVRKSWREAALLNNPDFNVPIVDLIAKNKGTGGES